MRVLSIFNRYTQYGGEEAVTERIGRLLESKSPECATYYFSTRELTGTTLMGRWKAPFKGLRNSTVLDDLRKLQAEHSYKLWLVHNTFPAMPPGVFSLARELSVPVAVMMHNYRFRCINGFLLRDRHHCDLCIHQSAFNGIRYKCWRNSYAASSYAALYQYLVRKSGIFGNAAAFIALSENQVPILKSMGLPGHKIHTLEHFVDIPVETTPPSAGGNVLFMGRLSYEKGANLLLEAWKKVNTTGRKLVFAGTGPEESRLKEYAARNAMTNVEFMGFASPENHAALWKRASFYAMPSIWEETAAMTILEGWANGRPALAFNKGAATGYLEDGTCGWLAPECTSTSLADTLRDALATGQTALSQMGAHARNRACRHHTAENWYNRFRCLYDSIIDSNEPGQ